MFVSPGVYVREIDLSQYVPLLASTTLGCLGRATKGPVDKPTLVTSEAELIRRFGNPITSDFGLYAAMQYLKYGRQLLFVRVTDKTETTASATVNSSPLPFMRYGCPAVYDSNRNVIVMFGGRSDNGGAPWYNSDTWEYNGTSWSKITTTGVPNSRAYHSLAFDSVRNVVVMFGGESGSGLLNDIWEYNGSTSTWTKRTGFTGTAPSIRKGAFGVFHGTTALIFGGYGVKSDGTMGYLNDTFTWNGASGGTWTALTPTHSPSVRAYTAGAYDGTNSWLFGGQGASALLSDTYKWSGTDWLVQSVSGPVARREASMLYDSTHAVLILFGGIGANSTYRNDIWTSAVDTPVWTNRTSGLVVLPPVRASAMFSPGPSSSIVLFGGFNGAQALSDQYTWSGTAWTKSQGSAALLFTAASPGTWANGVTVTLSNGSTSGYFNVVVSAPIDNAGTVADVESFRDLSLDPANDRYIVDAVTSGIPGEIRPSQYLTLTEPGTYPIIPLLGTSTLSGGTNGGAPTAADYIGTYSSQSTTGLKALANPELWDLNIVAVPGVADPAVINAMLEMCFTRHDCIAVVDPPMGLDVQGVVDWHNGTGGYTHQSFNSSFGALYWPWVQIYDPYNRQLIWLPPSGFAIAAMAQTDYATYPWFAPAGFNRGHLLSAIKLEMSPDLGQRDYLYGNGNAVNPIVNFTRDGITIWGQRTLQRMPSALDRVNARRGLLYLEKIVATAVKYLTFEPNDRITWRRLKDLIEPACEFMQANRGLYDFGVLCDDTTNTPFLIDNNEMHAKIWVKLTKAAEKIVLDFVVLSTGADFTEVTSG